MKTNLTNEEILKLPKDQFVSYMEQIETDRYNSMVRLEFPNYELLSHEEKVNTWCSELNFHMRKQAESGLDEYSMFKPIWYQTMKRLEPEFDLIIEKVFERFKTYNWEWSKEEYLRRISSDPTK